MQTLSSLTRIHSVLSLQVEGQDEVSQSPYQDPFCYLKAESCCIFPSAREIQMKIKILILPKQILFLIQQYLLFHLKHQKAEVIKQAFQFMLLKSPALLLITISSMRDQWNKLLPCKDTGVHLSIVWNLWWLYMDWDCCRNRSAPKCSFLLCPVREGPDVEKQLQTIPVFFQLSDSEEGPIPFDLFVI